MGYPFLPDNPEVQDQVGLEEGDPEYPWSEEDQEWSYFMINLWTNFAKYGWAPSELFIGIGRNSRGLLGLLSWAGAGSHESLPWPICLSIDDSDSKANRAN